MSRQLELLPLAPHCPLCDPANAESHRTVMRALTDDWLARMMEHCAELVVEPGEKWHRQYRLALFRREQRRRMAGGRRGPAAASARKTRKR